MYSEVIVGRVFGRADLKPWSNSEFNTHAPILLPYKAVFT